jgi:hypothetical protein
MIRPVDHTDLDNQLNAQQDPEPRPHTGHLFQQFFDFLRVKV